MSEAIPPLTIDIIFHTAGVDAGVAKVQQGLTQITTRTQTVTKSMSQFKATLLGVFGGNIATQGFMAIQKALIDSKNEFLESEVATKRLGQALENMGIKSEKTRESILKNVDAYASLGFQGPESANAMGTLVTATGDVEQATRLMAMAADLARYKHIDLGTAATILARGTQGSAKAFKELGITLDTTIPKNQAISKAFDQLNAKIGGQAVAYTKTFEGQMAVLKERLQETFNAIATRVLPILTGFFNLMNKGIEWVQKNSAALKVMGVIVATALVPALYSMVTAQLAIIATNPMTYIVAGVAAAIAIFVKLWNSVEGFRKLMAGMASVAVQSLGLVIGAVARLIRLMSYLPGMKFLKGVADQADKIAVSVGKAGESIEKLANKKITAPKAPSIAGIVAPGGKTNIAGNVPGGDTSKTGGAGGSQTVQYVTVYASNTNDIYKNLSKAAKNGVPVGGK